MFNGGLRLRKLHLAHCNGNHYNPISVTTEVEATPQPVKSSVPDHNKEETKEPTKEKSKEKPMEDIVKIFIFLERERELSPAFI